MLQVIFGDDEHTAADGPYVRVLKTRKWLYLLSFSALVLAQDLYDPVTTKEVLKVVTLPRYFLSSAVSVGIAYLGFQYLLLTGQLIGTYDITFRERLQFRRADDFAKAVEKVETAKAALQSQNSATNGIISQLLEDRQREGKKVNELRSQLSVYKARPPQYLKQVEPAAGELAYQQHVAQLEANIDVGQLTMAHLDGQIQEETETLTKAEQANLAAGVEKVDKAEAELSYLHSQDPSLRPGYRSFEVAIDISRVVVPFAFASYAFFEIISRVVFA